MAKAANIPATVKAPNYPSADFDGLTPMTKDGKLYHLNLISNPIDHWLKLGFVRHYVPEMHSHEG